MTATVGDAPNPPTARPGDRVTVRHLDRGGPDLERWFDVWQAAMAADRPRAAPPSRTTSLHWVRVGEPGYRTIPLLAEIGDRPCGHGWIELPLRDNLDTVLAGLADHPRWRGHGAATRMLAEAVDIARAQGRTRVVAESFEPLHVPVGSADPLAGVLEAAGATRRLASLNSVLDLADLPQPKLSALHDDALARAEGYAVELYAGTPPAHLHDDIARLERSLSTDAPFDDLRWEEEDWDAERVTGLLDLLAGAQARCYVALARHHATGRGVGWTQLVVHADVPEWAAQWSTVVAREHRGHRLGMLLKAANVAQLRAHEPAVTRVGTDNAGSNEHMLAVNRALGFRAVERAWEWELPVGDREPLAALRTPDGAAASDPAASPWRP